MAPRVSPEHVRLLNPAFLGLAVTRVAQGYQREADEGLPFVYSFIAMAMLLHSETRERLPSSVVTRLVPWAERNADVMTLFPRRVADIAPATRKGIFLASAASVISLGRAAALEPVMVERVIAPFAEQSGSAELQEIFAKGLFVGRWLATSGMPSTVLTTLGVRI